MHLAAVTMAYDEPELIPIWIRHYVRQVGARNCFLIDDGSDDGSTDELGGIGRLRLPRRPFNEQRRCRFLKSVCDSLLTYYDAVIYTDIDEIVLADPAYYPTLVDYAAAHPRDVSFCVGLNIQHVPALEAPLDPARSITEQRRFAWFSATMCKPLLIRRPVDWSVGFHCCEVPLEAGELFLFHLRWADRDIARNRQLRALALDTSEGKPAPYQLLPVERYLAQFDFFSRLPRRGHVRFDARSSGTMADMMARAQASRAGREHAEYRIDLNLRGDDLWPIPHRFRGTF